MQGNRTRGAAGRQYAIISGVTQENHQVAGCGNPGNGSIAITYLGP